MSTEPCMLCEEPVHAKGLCVMHYRRLQRQGNPYVERKPRCQTCMEIYRILTRPGGSAQAVTEKYTDIWLTFKTGSSYGIRDKDRAGREVTPRFREDQNEG